jgi:hypothetical protein
MRRTTPIRPRRAAAALCREIFSCRKRSERGRTKIVVVFASTAVRPAETPASAVWARKKKKPNWKRPIAPSAGRSRRPGQASLPPRAASRNAAAPERTARPAANHNGSAPAVMANLVTGHEPPKRTTPPSKATHPRPARRSAFIALNPPL